MMTRDEAARYYPTAAEIDDWLARLWAASEQAPLTVTPSDDRVYVDGVCTNYNNGQLLRFETPGLPAFYGLWHPPVGSQKPLAVFLPGYGGELSPMPFGVARDFAYLSLAPLGYGTPDAVPRERMVEGDWPVLPDTLLTRGEGGYFHWLLQAALAVKWTWRQTEAVLPDRVSFFGTSQGGGTALLLGSLFAGRGTRCVMADEPFLTDYLVGAEVGCFAHYLLARTLSALPEEEFWHYAGLVDTVSHAHRLTVPVLLTEGAADAICPPATVRGLFDRLPATKALVSLSGRGHGHNREFGRLVTAWLDMYA